MAARQIYRVGNWTRPTTAAPVKRATGTAIRTMLQVASTSTQGFQIVQWGIAFDASAAGTPINVELFGTTVAATMSTALAAADVQCITDENAPAVDFLQFGTSLSGYATAAVTEGTVANYRQIDVGPLIAPTSLYVLQQPLGNEGMIDVSQFVRVRVTAAADVNMLTYLDVARL